MSRWAAGSAELVKKWWPRLALGIAVGMPLPALAAPDLVLFNGKIITLDDKPSEAQAIAIEGEKIQAVGSNEATKSLAGPATKLVDLEGRTVIPGLTDGHIHGIRAALTFGTETSWIGVPTLQQALAKIKAAAATQKPGSWIIVAGGWTEEQFAEKRRPTVAEIVAAAPDNPVFIQHLYDWLLLSPKAMQALAIKDDADIKPRGKLIRDAAGAPTGEITGDGVSLLAIFDKLPKPTFAEMVEGSARFFRDLNRLGLTGIVDGAGTSMYPASYAPLFQLWRDHRLTVRVAYHLSAPKPGTELADLQNLTQLLPQNFGDAMLHFNGPGEILIWSAWTDGDITPDAKAKVYDMLRWAAEERYSIQLHWNPDRTVDNLIDVLQRVNAEFPIGDLRWTILHLYDVTQAHLEKLHALNVTWGVQDGPYFGGERLQRQVGVDAAKHMPMIKTALRMGLRVAGGTDAHRVSDYSPFVALRWYLDGKTIGRVKTRDDAEAPSRIEALQMYTKKTPRSSPTRIRSAARSKSANWPISRCCPKTTSASPWKRSPRSSPCSPWSAAEASTPRRPLTGWGFTIEVRNLPVRQRTYYARVRMIFVQRDMLNNRSFCIR